DITVELGEATVRSVIHHYTKEAGVRNLERELATVFRKVAKEVVKSGKNQTFRISTHKLPKYLGPHKYRGGRQEEGDLIGLCNGLAVTMHGGDILPAEVSVVPGKGKIVLTGKLGDVMQ